MTGEKYDEAISVFEEASALKQNEDYPEETNNKGERVIWSKSGQSCTSKRNTMILFQKELGNLEVKIGSQQNQLLKKHCVFFQMSNCQKINWLEIEDKLKELAEQKRIKLPNKRSMIISFQRQTVNLEGRVGSQQNGLSKKL